MSFIIRDSLSPRVAELNMKHALYRRFSKVWPNNGSVYDKKLVYYDHNTGLRTDEPFKRWLNIIGAKYEDLEAVDYSKNEIEQAWFYIQIPALQGIDFTPLEAYEAMDSYENGTFVDRRLFAEEVVTIVFKYGGQLETILIEDKLEIISNTYDEQAGTVTTIQTVSITPEEIRDKILLDPGMYVIAQKESMSNTSRTVATYVNDEFVDGDINYETSLTYNEDETFDVRYAVPVVAIETNKKYGWYGLFDNAKSTFEITNISDVSKQDYNPALAIKDMNGYQFSVTYKLKTDLTDSSQCMIDFIQLFNDRKDILRSSGSLPIKITQQDYVLANPTVDPILWPGDQLSVPLAADMKRKDFADMFGAMIDTDHKVEEAETWEKALAVVIMIIAIIVFVVILVYCTACAVASAPELSLLAAAFGAASVVLSIGSAILGYYGGASAMYLVKTIGKVAQYVGYVATILGIYAIISNFSKQIVTEASKNLAANATTTEIAIQYTKAIIKVATEAITSAVQNAIGYGAQSFVEVAKAATGMAGNAFQIYQYYDQNFGDMAKIKEETDKINEELAELEKLNEENAPHLLMMMEQDVYTYSLGSFDALAELDIKINQSTGGYMEEMDPAARLT